LAAESPEPDIQSFQRLSIEPSLCAASPANDRSTHEASNLRKRSRQVAIVISDSDDEEVSNRLSRPAPASRDLRRQNSGLDVTDQDEIVSVLPSIEFGNDKVVIDLTAEDELEAAIIWDEEEAELRRLAACIKPEKYPTRNPAIKIPLVEIERCDWKGGILRSGKTIELVNGSFLRIMVIVENVSTGEIHLRGWLLKRNTELNGLIPWQHNELCYIFEVDQNDSRLAREQCVEEAGLKEIAKIRRVVYTNQSYPAFNNYDELRERGKQTGNRWRKWVEEQEVLVVRWKSSPTFRNAQHRMKVRKNPNSDHIIPKLEMLRQDECSAGKGVSAKELRFQFRGPTILGGSHKEFAYQNQATSGPQGNLTARVQNCNFKPRLGPKTTFMSLEDDQEFVIREPGRRNQSQTNTAPSCQVQSQNRLRQRHSSQHNGTCPTSGNGRLASTSPQNPQSRRIIQRYDFGDWCKLPSPRSITNPTNISQSAAPAVHPVEHLHFFSSDMASTKTHNLANPFGRTFPKPDSTRWLCKMYLISLVTQTGFAWMLLTDLQSVRPYQRPKHGHAYTMPRIEQRCLQSRTCC
jgi:hypothetical protein